MLSVAGNCESWPFGIIRFFSAASRIPEIFRERVRQAALLSPTLRTLNLVKAALIRNFFDRSHRTWKHFCSSSDTLFMSYHPRIESAEFGSFLTTRARNSELWFVNNRPLEQAILGYAAKYSHVHEVKLYALAIEGNHIQGPADFPKCNRAAFMRDFNSMVARAVPIYVPSYPGGRLWGRRYSSEFLPAEEDIEKQFFYTVLQVVQDGLAERISDYEGYNCFHDAVCGIKRKHKVVRWAEFNAARRYNPNRSIKDFTDIYELSYERLPGYEHLSKKEYVKLMLHKLEQHRQEIVAERRKAGLGFATPEALRQIKPGATPKRTKTSTHTSHRPRVICTCPQRRAQTLEWYFSCYAWYKDSSRLYRLGELDVEFPPRMYKPSQTSLSHQ